MLLDALPGDSSYKTALMNSYGDEALAEMSQLAPEGHGRWSHTDLLLAHLIDLVGVFAYGKGVFERAPEPYRRPGILPRRRKRNPAITAEIERIAREHADLHGYSIDDM